MADVADVTLGVSDETLAGNVALGKDDVAQLGLFLPWRRLSRIGPR